MSEDRFMEAMEIVGAKTFGKRLWGVRTLRGMSMKKLSVISGISVCRISQYETNGVLPRFDVGCKIANALKVEVMWLAFGAGEL